MALVTFTSLELDAMRRDANALGLSTGLKAQVNAGLQAVENWMESGFAVQPATSLSAAIDAATTPLVFTNAQKKFLMRVWLMGLARRGGF
jgi:hypothetical protein